MLRCWCQLLSHLFLLPIIMFSPLPAGCHSFEIPVWQASGSWAESTWPVEPGWSWGWRRGLSKYICNFPLWWISWFVLPRKLFGIDLEFKEVRMWFTMAYGEIVVAVNLCTGAATCYLMTELTFYYPNQIAFYRWYSSATGSEEQVHWSVANHSSLSIQLAAWLRLSV